MEPRVNWRQFKKIDVETVDETVKILGDHDYKLTPVIVEKVLRAPSLDHAVEKLLEFDTALAPSVAKTMAVNIVRVYTDTRTGDGGPGATLAVSLNVTEEEMGQIKDDMGKVGIEDVDIFIRSALQTYSQILALCGPHEKEVMIKHCRGMETALPLAPPTK